MLSPTSQPHTTSQPAFISRKRDAPMRSVGLRTSVSTQQLRFATHLDGSDTARMVAHARIYTRTSAQISLTKPSAFEVTNVHTGTFVAHPECGRQPFALLHRKISRRQLLQRQLLQRQLLHRPLLQRPSPSSPRRKAWAQSVCSLSRRTMSLWMLRTRCLSF